MNSKGKVGVGVASFRTQSRGGTGRARRYLNNPWSTFCIPFLLLGLMHSCIAVDGGAAEFTWTLRTPEGKRLEDACENSGIATVRLCWNNIESGDQGCRPGQFADFDCERETGVTSFVIPEGPTRFYVQPVCEGGVVSRPRSYQVPPDIVRTVQDGEIVTLDSLLIVATEQSETCGLQCTCPST